MINSCYSQNNPCGIKIVNRKIYTHSYFGLILIKIALDPSLLKKYFDPCSMADDIDIPMSGMGRLDSLLIFFLCTYLCTCTTSSDGGGDDTLPFMVGSEVTKQWLALVAEDFEGTTCTSPEPDASQSSASEADEVVHFFVASAGWSRSFL